MVSFKSASGLAKQLTGSVGNFRQILNFNPGRLPFQLPPTVKQGIQAANSFGLKVPSADQLQQLATGQLDLILKGARRDVLSTIEQAQTQALSGLGTTPQEILNKIEWLL